MNPERWKRAEELFEKASKMPEGQWPGFLVSEVSDDLELIDTVLKMLRSRSAGKFIEPPTGSSAPAKLPDGQPWIGRRLGDFELTESIGHGGMGLVFKARQVSLKRDVAVKILPFSSLARPDHLARFAKEARAAARLHHPNIVPIYAVGEEGDVHWFAMELVDGPDLAKEIKRLAGKESGAERRESDVERRESGPTAKEEGAAGKESGLGKKEAGAAAKDAGAVARESSAAARLPPFESREYLTAVVRLVEQAADALAYAHQNGVVHRDIKPHNLLVDPAGQMRVVDFGLARDEEQGTITSSSDQLGSPYYMSPEQVKHRMHAVDARTDVYSLGVVLYELLTLKRPFDGATSAEVWHRIVHAEPRKLRSIAPRVSKDLATICSTAMARELVDRYPSAAAFRDDLRRFLNHEQIDPPRPSPMRLVRRFIRRHPVAYGAAATAVIAVTAGFLSADVRARRNADEANAKAIRSVLKETDWEKHVAEVASVRRLWLELRAREASLPDELGKLERELGESFTKDFETRRQRMEENLAAGLGGTRDPERFGGHRAPYSTIDLGLFLRESERVRTIYADLPDVEALCDISRTEPHVSLHLDEATNAAIGSEKAHASMRPIDPLVGTRGATRDLGDLPLPNIAVPPGNWRFIVEIRGFGFAEYTRYLLPRPEPYALEIRVLRSEAVQAGMRAIDAGRYKFDEASPSKCDAAGTTSDFDAFLIDEADVSNGEFIRFLSETGRPPPRRWTRLGYKGDWHDLPIGDVGDRFLDLPVVGLAYFDAQSYAEWAGKRLPTHIELERALRGSDGRLYPAGESDLPREAANYNVYEPSVNTSTSPKGDFALYLKSVKPVRDSRYRQPPEELFHTYGNVAKVSESVLFEPEDGDILAIKIWERVGFGAAWDAQVSGNNLQTHATFGVSERYTRTFVGLRCCKSRSP